MNTSETAQKLAPALAAAWSQFKDVAKNGHNGYDHYDYSTLEDYMDAVSDALKANGLALVTQVDHVERLDDRTTKNKNVEHAVQVRITGRLIHTSGEWIEATSFGEGQDRGDKCIYKAITGARKYLMSSMLSLVTSDDPERDASSQQQSEQPQANPKPPAEPDDWSDDSTSRVVLYQTLNATGKYGEQAGAAVNGWLKELGLSTFDATTAEQRRQLYLWLTGQAESYTPDEPVEA